MKQQKTVRVRAAVAAIALVSASIVAGGATGAKAGALAIREQSSQFQGSAFAGNAAGGGLSSTFWNSAAIAEADPGLSTDSSYTVIFGRTEFSDVALNGIGNDQTDQTSVALVAGSYGAYRVSETFALGIAVTAPYGLQSKVDNQGWLGQVHHRSASLFTLNANPVASVRIAPGLLFGAGLQIQYAKLRFKTASALDPTSPNAVLNGDDIGFGYTLGLLWKPTKRTSIGLGYRSAVSHVITGDQFVVGAPGPRNEFELAVDTPDMVTLSVRHAVTDRFRFLGTVEWTNWDRLNVHPVRLTNLLGTPTVATFDFQYANGWFFSVGGEYDYSDRLTFRAGLAYELSPVDDPTKRLPQVPDADRIWLSAGLTYKWSESTSLNFAYTHIFVADSSLNRIPAGGQPLVLTADLESAVDIVSVGYTMKFGGGPAPLK